MKFGPYEILSLLGVGGMGEVWQARDTRLGRNVAIKVLPEELFEGEERRVRFEREARLLASLNHPGIATLYSFEEIPGTSSRHILVMELLEGATLRERLRAGPLPPRRALDVAVQMAKGLAAAHEKGIVHRDLKPENVFLTKDDRVKILDLGLAKLVRPETGENLTKTETVSALTESGVVMGTVGYMSPEQVRGEPVNHRSDIFSFGTILHEMISGKNPFRKETSAETMTAILREDPPPLPEVPSLSLIAVRCLEKRQERRFQSTEDLAFALDSISKGSATVGPAQVGSPAVARRHIRARWIAFTAAAALLMAGAWLVSKWAGTPPQLTFERLTFRRGVVWSARFTPDGQSVVYGAAWDGKPVELFETRVGGTESRALGFEPGNILAISRAGEMAIALRPSFIFTFKHPGTLARASLAGGAARELLADVNAADWSPDGMELAAAHESNGKFLLEFPPGKAILESEGILGDLRFSPDGSRIAFWEYTHSRARVVVVSSDGSGRRVLSDGWQVYSIGLAWAPDGREIWFTAARDLRERSAIYAVDLSAQVRLVSRMPGSLELFDVARDGRVLMSHAVEGPGVVVHAPGAAAERDLSWLGLSFLGDLSWDGRTVVFTEAGVLYLRKTDGSAAVRLGNGFGLGAVALSPDGAWVAAAMTGSHARLALVPTGAGASRELALKGLDAVNSVLWTHDSKTIFFLGWQDGHGVRIYRQDLSEENPRSITTDILGADGLVLSPDGHSLASLSEGSLRLFSIEGTALQVVPGNFSGHTLIGWASDGRALYSYRITDLPGRIYRLDVATGALQVFREMLPADPAGIWRIHPIRITPDGSSYAYTYSRRLGDLYVFDGLK